MTTKPIRATGRKDQNSGIAGIEHEEMPTISPCVCTLVDSLRMPAQHQAGSPES